jgi:hypothetical protein
MKSDNLKEVFNGVGHTKFGIKDLKIVGSLLSPDKYNNIDPRILYYLVFDQKTADDYSALTLQEIEMKKSKWSKAKFKLPRGTKNAALVGLDNIGRKIIEQASKAVESK